MKKFINKIVDMPKLIRRIWIILWLSLIILLIMKFCFGIWYPIAVHNTLFINICNYIDNHTWLSHLIMILFYMINFTMIFLTSTQSKFKGNMVLITVLLLISIPLCILKIYYNTVGSIIEMILIIGAPIIYNIIKNNKSITNIILPVVVYIIVNLWQLLIFLVRGLDIHELTSYPSLIPYILQLDYYVFIIITWIGVNYMGAFGIGWLWSKDVTELKALKEKELAKENPDKDLIADIDNAIVKKTNNEIKE